MKHAIALVLALVCAQIAWADDTAPTDPQTVELQTEAARLKAQADVITQQNALITAKYGAAPTAPTGTITNPEKFSAMGQWTLGAATLDAASEIVGWVDEICAASRIAEATRDVCASVRSGLLITSNQDRRAASATADLIEQRLDAFTQQLQTPLGTVTGARAAGRSFAFSGAAAAISGTIGTLDSLVGLFRSDFSLSDLGVTADDLALRIAVAAEMRRSPRSMNVDVDGLAGPPGKKYNLLSAYDKFDSARSMAAAEYARVVAALKTDSEKAKYADRKALLDAATVFDTALTTPVSGQVPLISAALAEDVSGKGKYVLYVKFAGYSSSIVTRKRLLSRNDEVTAIAGGTAQAALFDTHGDIVGFKIVRIDERVGGHLTEIVKKAKQIDQLQN